MLMVMLMVSEEKGSPLALSSELEKLAASYCTLDREKDLLQAVGDPRLF